VFGGGELEFHFEISILRVLKKVTMVLVGAAVE
jgi:hypothetical protein